MNTCKVPDCNRAVRSLGYCGVHYFRMRAHGNPHTTLKTPTGTPLEERLTEDKWKKVEGALETPCWEWQKHTDTFGYGRIKFNGKSLKLHRVMYERAHGAIPTGKSVLHRCDNPPCSNPDHLFVGTQRDNIADMVSKGRQGSSRPKSDDYIRQVRALVKGGMTQTEVARLMSTDSGTVSRIVHRKLYKDVE